MSRGVLARGEAEGGAFRDPRTVLRERGLGAKKSWGQNFLIDRVVHRRIAHAARLAPDDVVIEIGAGLGTLTAELARCAGRVIAVERDRDMLEVLATEIGSHAGIEIRAQDAQTLDFAAEARAAGRPVVVVGNLPYQIASPLLFAAAGAGGAVARAVVMVQREMAVRMAAVPGSRDYGRLSVMLQQAADVKVLFHVSPGAFHPRPRVVSSVVSLVPRRTSRAPVRDPGVFDAVVRAAFTGRRKTLRRSLALGFADSAVVEALGRTGIDGIRRAETLAIDEFARLADAFVDTAGPGVVPDRMRSSGPADRAPDRPASRAGRGGRGLGGED